MIKSRRMSWAGYVARMGRREMYTKFRSENLKGGNHSEDLGVDGRIKSEWILKKYIGRVWTGFTWIRIGIMAGRCKHSNVPEKVDC
jgi:hypothetical protein